MLSHLCLANYTIYFNVHLQINQCAYEHILADDMYIYIYT